MAYNLLEAWEPLGTGSLNTLVGYGWSFDGNPQIQTGNQRSGSRCIQIDATEAGIFSVPATATKSFGLAYKFTGTLSGVARSNPIAYFSFVSGNPIWIRLNGGGAIVIMDGTTEVATGTTVITAGVYNFFEVKINSTTGEIDVYLNFNGVGSPTPEVSATVAGRGNGNSFRIGWLNTISSGSQPNGYFDDIYVRNDGVVTGDSAVLYAFPDGNNVPQDWVPSSGNAWERIDNVPVDAAQYIEAASASDLSTFDFAGYVPTMYQLYCVGLIANWIRTGATAETARLAVNVGGTDYFDAAVTVPQTTAAWSRSYWDQDPSVSAPWNPLTIQTGSVNSLERVT